MHLGISVTSVFSRTNGYVITFFVTIITSSRFLLCLQAEYQRDKFELDISLTCNGATSVLLPTFPILLENVKILLLVEEDPKPITASELEDEVNAPLPLSREDEANPIVVVELQFELEAALTLLLPRPRLSF